MCQLDHPGARLVFILNQPDGSYKPDEIQQKERKEGRGK